jgi:hypothetical protein
MVKATSELQFVALLERPWLGELDRMNILLGVRNKFGVFRLLYGIY